MKEKKSSKKHTEKELAEAIVFPVSLNPIQKKEAAEQLVVARKKSQSAMTEIDKLTLQVFQLKFQK